MELKGKGFLLRPWRHGDEESLARHANNRSIWRNLLDRFPHPYTVEDANSWVASCQEPERARTEFAIIVDGAAVGGIGFQIKQDVFRRTANIGYWLGEAYWGRGICTEALRLVTEYAFAHFDLERLQAGVFEWNVPSMRVLEKAGYQLEGRLRRNVFKDGQFIDELIYARLR